MRRIRPMGPVPVQSQEPNDRPEGIMGNKNRSWVVEGRGVASEQGGAQNRARQKHDRANKTAVFFRS